MAFISAADLRSRWQPLYVALSTSTPIVNTTAETPFSTSVPIDANTLRVGSRLRLRASGLYSDTGTPILRLKARFEKAGPVDVALYDSGGMTCGAGVSGVFWSLALDLTVRAIGAAGIVAASGGAYLATTGVVPAVSQNRLGGTPSGGVALDTTAAQTLQLTAIWNAASPSNTVTVELMTVDLAY